MIELQMNGSNNKAFQKQQRRICSLFGDREKIFNRTQKHYL